MMGVLLVVMAPLGQSFRYEVIHIPRCSRLGETSVAEIAKLATNATSNAISINLRFIISCFGGVSSFKSVSMSVLHTEKLNKIFTLILLIIFV